jgi:hypothetical protein
MNKVLAVVSDSIPLYSGNGTYCGTRYERNIKMILVNCDRITIASGSSEIVVSYSSNNQQNTDHCGK